MKNIIKLALVGSVVLCLGLFAFVTIANAITGTWYGDTIGTRAFYNQKALQNGYTLIPTAFDGQGHVSNDAVTAQKMCELAGFNTVISRNCFEFGTSGRCNFTSCQNNVMGVWNTSTNNIDLVNACGHTWLASLTCGNTPQSCTSFTYSDWSACNNGTQTRTVLTSSPTGCTGGNPILSQTCASCTPNFTKKCSPGGDVYWYDSCNVRGSLFQECTVNQMCINGACIDKYIACSTNSQCGTNGLTGSPFCQNGNVFQNYRTYTCNDAGTANSSCSHGDVAQLQTTCSANQTCNNGSCVNQNVPCSTNSQCGTNGLTGSPFCQGNGIYQNYTTYTCNNPGTATSSCSNVTTPQSQSNCTANQTCYNGQCNNNPVSQTTTPTQTQTQTQNNNQVVYVNTPTPTPVYTVNQNHYNDYNNPATIQTTQATNIQNNQATLNGYLNISNTNYCTSYVWFQWGTTTAYGNTTNQQAMNSSNSFSQSIYGAYSGNTYHFRAVGRDCSGNTIYGQDQTFYVYPQVLGASSVSTGLTNNFWVDSFILPLILTLIGIWVLKSGKFFSAEKKLNKRISDIKRLEQI